MEAIVVNTIFLQNSRIKSLSRVVIDSVLLIDTFLMVFRTSRGRYAGSIVPDGLLGKEVFQTAFFAWQEILAMPMFLCLVLWSAVASSTRLDRG